MSETPAQITRERIAHQLEAVRRAKGLTQNDLSRRIGRSVTRLSEIEAARANPSLDNLADLADALGLEVVLVPREHLLDVLHLSSDPDREIPRIPHDVPSVLDEVMIEAREEPEGGKNAFRR